ncbi:hypothetical protein KEM63_01310 [Halopseudomonas nanhaiensis]|uniref:alpha/beta hydrolase family esterase n=1 Tax=Halopseudomonas nanhaiensis TaxID=2830842 RepID=UPI00226B57DA|nr:alpha/beta hydrolase-fold protein [Halopseudomonas nanhaiensis]UAW98652.1 hypothetical protein KEM63_01310 [Halopseudomonas nanhaiensis]
MKAKLGCWVLMALLSAGCGGGGGGGSSEEAEPTPTPTPTPEEQTPPPTDTPDAGIPTAPQNPPNRPSSPRPQPQDPESEEEEEEESPADPSTPGPILTPTNPDPEEQEPEEQPAEPVPTEPEEPTPAEPEEPNPTEPEEPTPTEPEEPTPTEPEEPTPTEPEEPTPTEPEEPTPTEPEEPTPTEPQDPAPSEPDDPVLNPYPYASAGCGFEPLAEGEHSLQINGVSRKYTVDLPTGYDQDRAYPVVFGFHGRGRDGQFQNTDYGNLASTMGDDAILIYPEGLSMDNQGAVGDKHGGSGTTWELEGTADLQFFDAMLQEAKVESCVDEQRIYTVGFSMGGYFSARLACERGMDVRAFAAAGAGAPVVDPNMCEDMSAAWIAHDPEDSAIDYEAGGVALRDYWLDVNMCGPETQPVASEGNCVEYTNCAADFPVRWCTYSQGSNHHQWPNFGPREVWDFFLSLE